MTYAFAPLRSLPLTHFPTWLSSLPAHNSSFLLQEPHLLTILSHHRRKPLKNRLHTQSAVNKQRSKPKGCPKGPSSPVRMAHSLKRQDPLGCSCHLPVRSVSPRSETRVTAKFGSCSRRTSQLPVKKKETGRKGNQRNARMRKRREGPEKGKEGRGRAETYSHRLRSDWDNRSGPKVLPPTPRDVRPEKRKPPRGG